MTDHKETKPASDDGILSPDNLQLPPIEERPLVTFAVFAYNQEKYIREAVEGAFAQTYEPLEIILSDDCSTDHTFEIMQEMAAAYKGPHDVKIYKNTKNEGTLSHVLKVGRISRGKVVVLAAGDDISLPERCNKIEPVFRDPIVWGAYSKDVIMRNGILERDVTRSFKRNKKHNIMKNCDFISIHGATSAYRRDVFEVAPYPTDIILVEDYPLSVIILSMEKKIIYIDSPLVIYRWHENNISVRNLFTSDYDSLLYHERLSMQRRSHVFKAMKYILDVSSEQLMIGSLLRKNLKKRRLSCQAKYMYLLSRWAELKFHEKIHLLYLALFIGSLKEAISRLFGLSVFVALKRKALQSKLFRFAVKTKRA